MPLDVFVILWLRDCDGVEVRVRPLVTEGVSDEEGVGAIVAVHVTEGLRLGVPAPLAVSEGVWDPVGALECVWVPVAEGSKVACVGTCDVVCEALVEVEGVCEGLRACVDVSDREGVCEGDVVAAQLVLIASNCTTQGVKGDGRVGSPRTQKALFRENTNLQSPGEDRRSEGDPATAARSACDLPQHDTSGVSRSSCSRSSRGEPEHVNAGLKRKREPKRSPGFRRRNREAEA